MVFENQINWIRAHYVWSALAALIVVVIVIMTVMYTKKSFSQRPLNLVQSTQVRGSGIGNNPTLFMSGNSDNASLQPLIPNISLMEVQDNMPMEASTLHNQAGMKSFRAKKGFSVGTPGALAELQGLKLLNSPVAKGRSAVGPRTAIAIAAREPV